MRYSFTTPAGWSRSPFPPPQRGVYLRAPSDTPSPEGASVLLFDAVAPAGSLEEHLQTIIEHTCESTPGLKITKRGKPAPIETTGYTGLSIALTVQIPEGRRTRDELRVYYLIEAGDERLPVTFVGGPKSLGAHQQALDTLISSIGPLVLAPELYRRWVE